VRGKGANVSPISSNACRAIHYAFSPIRLPGPSRRTSSWAQGVSENEFSASTGDLFPYGSASQARQLIGKRSWGGVIGIRGSCVPDNGTLNKPSFRGWPHARVDHREHRVVPTSSSTRSGPGIPGIDDS